MGDKTGIEWTDATWNPVRGVKGKWSCVKVSPGCANCYAERLNVRTGGPEYVVGADQIRLDYQTLLQPLRWKRPRRIFVESMGDLFEARVRDEWIGAVFGVMARARQHTFQVLTKRAARMRRWHETWAVRDGDAPALNCASDLLLYEAAKGPFGDGGPVHCKWGPDPDAPWPLPNVWLGVSAEDQAHLDERVPDLLETPAAVRWVSLEPLLDPINLRARGESERHLCVRCGLGPAVKHDHPDGYRTRGLDWIVVGGESGPGARPCDLAWVRSIRDQCRAAGVPAFVKQLGARPVWTNPDARSEFDQAGGYVGLSDRKGGDPSEWPEDLRVREWPR